jgi:3',5'-cyclic AMP phosphodiesterase CpdA
MRIIHISDLHFPVRVPFWKLRGKMFSGYFNYALRRRKKYPVEGVYALIQRIKTLPYDLLILSGDITNVAHEKEFEEARKILNPILDERAFLIPGNHDRYTKGALAPNDLFLKYFGEFLGSEIGQSPHYLRTKELEKCFLIGWDSNEPTGIGDASGFVPLEVIDQSLEFIKAQKKPYLLVCHHPIWNPPNKQENSYHKLRNRDFIISKLKSHPPLAYFHGHLHTNWVLKKNSEIPFFVFNSASSTRVADKIHHSGFHYILIKESEWEIKRYHYQEEAKNYLETQVVYY